MRTRRSPVFMFVSLLTMLSYVLVATGCLESRDRPPPGPSTGATRVVVIDSSGTETTAELDFAAEVVPVLDNLVGGAPEAPEQIFTVGGRFTTRAGTSLALTPGLDGLTVAIDGETQAFGIAWDGATRELRFGGAALTSLSVLFADDVDHTREAAQFALASVVTLAMGPRSGNAIPILVVVVVAGLAAYLACVTLGCNFMCKNNCAPHGVDSCGCGIVTRPDGGTDYGYSCNCRKCPAPAAGAPDGDVCPTPSPSPSPSASPSPSPSASPSPSPSASPSPSPSASPSPSPSASPSPSPSASPSPSPSPSPSASPSPSPTGSPH